MEKGSSNIRWFIWGGVLGVAILGVVFALALNNSSASDEIEVGNAFVEVSGEPLPLFDPSNTVDDAIGLIAPNLRGVTPDGETVAVLGEDGKPKVIIFLAHWCKVCQAEVPSIVEWVGSGGDISGVDVYGVATAVDATKNNYPPGVWLTKENWPFLTLLDAPDILAATAYGLPAFPYFVAIDQQGKIVARGSGALNTEQLEDVFDAARSGVPVTINSGGQQTKVS